MPVLHSLNKSILENTRGKPASDFSKTSYTRKAHTNNLQYVCEKKTNCVHQNRIRNTCILIRLTNLDKGMILILLAVLK